MQEKQGVVVKGRETGEGWWGAGRWTVGSRPNQSRDKTALLRKTKDTGPEVGGGKVGIRKATS